MINKQLSNELAVVVQETGLEQSKVEKLMTSFGDSFKNAKHIAREAKAIVVTDDNQVDEMTKAREYRLSLRTIRIDVEKTRKALKEQSLREGRAIDGLANVIKALVVPVEEHLEKQEKFLELKLQAEADAKYDKRVAQLQPYIEDLSVYSLREMTDEAFNNLLEGAKLAHAKQVEATKKAEAERLAKEEEERKEQERIRKENIKLKAEAEEREKKAEEQRKAQEAKEAKLKQEQEAKLEAERKKREAIETKLREKQETEEVKRKAKEEIEKQAVLAPDKEKLNTFATTIDNLTIPSVKSRKAHQIIENTLDILSKLSNNIRQETKTL